MRVLVIGGAGFIGSHLTDALIEQGHSVRVLDNLSPQVHVGCAPPDYLNHHAELFRGDVRNPESLRCAVEGTDAIFHLAGAVGVGDSMYRIRDYVEINTLGAANLLDILANQKHAVQKLILSSSVTVYGEGKYRCPDHDIVFPEARSAEQVAAKDWNLWCPIQEREKNCSAALTPLPTDEKKPLSPQSVYAITKRNQEELFFATGQAYGIPVVVMRYFNVYGPHQALSNPYTGVVKIFGATLAQGRSPILYEDGLQSRDFVHVSDVVRASLLALERKEANNQVFNVGTGKPTTVRDVASALASRLGFKGELQSSNRCRAGDVRHCWADTSKIRRLLGFEPRFVFPAGVEDVLDWSAAGGEVSSEKAQLELEQRGLIS